MSRVIGERKKEIKNARKTRKKRMGKEQIYLEEGRMEFREKKKGWRRITRCEGIKIEEEEETCMERHFQF